MYCISKASNAKTKIAPFILNANKQLVTAFK